jgi:F-type H+-transporting ATPase subunit a
MKSPLDSVTLFHLGPAPITAGVVTTWVIMLCLVLGGTLLTRRLSLVPSATQAAFELVVDTVDSQIRDTMRLEPGPYRSFIGTLFLFIFVANWSTLIPGVQPPTAHIETDAALALLVFLAVIWFGIRASGVRGYLGTFASPNPIMIPLNFIESITRTFSLLVRLFGNVMSGVFVVSIVSAAMAVSFGAIGPALAEGRAVAAAMDAIARQPESSSTISRTLFVGLAMIETMAIYCLVIALLLLFANPLLK